MKIVTIVIVKVMPMMMMMMIMMMALVDNQICQELWVFGGKDRHWEATDHIQVLYSLHHHNTTIVKGQQKVFSRYMIIRRFLP